MERELKKMLFLKREKVSKHLLSVLKMVKW